MQRTVRRTAGFTAAFAAVALIAAGCGDDDKTPSVGDLTESGKAAVGSMTDSAKSAIESATATTAPGETAPGAGGAGGAGETKIQTPNGEVAITGPIYEKYVAAGGDTSPLGLPEGAEESAPGGGKYQEFAGGIIYWNDATKAHIVWGEIRTAWENEGGPDGALGYPTSDEKDIAGGKQSDFQNGDITYIDGKTTVNKK